MDYRRGKKSRLHLSARRKKCHLNRKSKFWHQTQSSTLKCSAAPGPPTTFQNTPSTQTYANSESMDSDDLSVDGVLNFKSLNVLPTTKHDTTETKTQEQEVSEEARGQELCEKIKNSLKQLRRLSVGEEESSGYKENPSLNLEVFPEEADNTDEPQDKGEPSSEFYDESETPELFVPKKNKEYTFPAKPIKRNPRRKAVLQQEIQKSILAAQKSPALEKVFVNSNEKHKETNKISKSVNSAHSDSSEITSNFNRTEQLYEFGKYIAEQMLCFDDKDVDLAQQEIKEVLSKFRLKYKIMKGLSKPKNDQPESDTDSQVVIRPAKRANTTELQTKSTKQKTSKQSVAKSTPRGNTKIPKKSVSQKTAKSGSQKISADLLTQTSQMISSDSLVTPTLQMNTLRPSEIQNESQIISAGSVMTPSLQINTSGPSRIQNRSQIIRPGSSVTPSLQVNTAELSRIQNGSQMIRAGSLVTPSLQVNTAGPLRIQNRSQIVSAGSIVIPSLQMSTSGPSSLQNGSQLTISGLSRLPQMVSVVPALKRLDGLNRNSPLSTPVGFVVVPASSEYQIPTQRVDSVRTMIQPVTLQVNPNQTVNQPGSAQIISTGPLVTQPQEVNSESLRPYKITPTHYIEVGPVNEPESFIIKCEAKSDEET